TDRHPCGSRDPVTSLRPGSTTGGSQTTRARLLPRRGRPGGSDGASPVHASGRLPFLHLGSNTDMPIRHYQPGDETAQAAIYNRAAGALPAFKPATPEEVARRYRSSDPDPTTKFYAVADGH